MRGSEREREGEGGKEAPLPRSLMLCPLLPLSQLPLFQPASVPLPPCNPSKLCMRVRASARVRARACAARTPGPRGRGGCRRRRRRRAATRAGSPRPAAPAPPPSAPGKQTRIYSRFSSLLVSSRIYSPRRSKPEYTAPPLQLRHRQRLAGRGGERERECVCVSENEQKGG